MFAADPCSTAAAGVCPGSGARSPSTVQPLSRRVQIRDLLTSPVLAELMELRVPSSAQDAGGAGAEGSGGAGTGRPGSNWCAAVEACLSTMLRQWASSCGRMLAASPLESEGGHHLSTQHQAVLPLLTHS